MNNKTLQVVFLSPIGARHKYLLILFPFSYQVYNPASDTRPASLLLNCLRGPVWLSHNKTAPALDAAQTTSLRYEIISRRRSVQTFPRPRPKILTSPCYFRRQLQHTSGIPRELTNEDVVTSTSANWSTVIVQHSTQSFIWLSSLPLSNLGRTKYPEILCYMQVKVFPDAP